MEAEGRALRSATLRTGMGLACLFVAAILLLVGIGFSLWACYQWLSCSMGPIGAKALIGLFTMAIAGGLAWTAIRINR
jgi:hypothetical protein